jgi:hypothetical protein
MDEALAPSTYSTKVTAYGWVRGMALTTAKPSPACACGGLESNDSEFSVGMRLSASRTVATATTSEFVTYPNGTVVRFVPEQVSHGLLVFDAVPQCNSQLETRLARPDPTPDTEPSV